MSLVLPHFSSHRQGPELELDSCESCETPLMCENQCKGLILPQPMDPAYMHNQTQFRTEEMEREGRMRPEDYSLIIMNYLFIIPINSEKSLPLFLLP